MFKERLTAITKVETIRKPMVVIDPKALQVMEAIVDNCKTEVAWFGYVDALENDVYHIRDIFILPQVAHSTTCEVDTEAFTNYATIKMKEADYSPEVLEEMGKLKLWGHSHVNMGVSPSGQDEDQLKEFKNGNSYFIRVIGNKKGDLEFTLMDFVNNLKFVNIPWGEAKTRHINEADIIAELKEKVQEKITVISRNTSNPHYPYWWNKQYDDPHTVQIASIDMNDEDLTGKEIADLLNDNDIRYLQSEVPSNDDKYAYLKDEFSCMGTVTLETLAEVLQITEGM